MPAFCSFRLSFAPEKKPDRKLYSNIPWEESSARCQLCDFPVAALRPRRSQAPRCHRPLKLAARSGADCSHTPFLFSGYLTAAHFQGLQQDSSPSPCATLRNHPLPAIKGTLPLYPKSTSQLACSSCGKAAFIYTGSVSTALPTSHPRLNSAAGDSLNPVSSQPMHTLTFSFGYLCSF